MGLKRRDTRDPGVRSERPLSRQGAAGARVPASGAERRKFERHARRVQVLLATGDGAEFDGQSRDVSEGGMFVTTDFFIPPCTVVQVTPAEPGLKPTTATVVRSRDLGGDFGMGLWFDPPDNDNGAPKK